MYHQTLPIILASKSPRRQELLKLMNLDFRVELKDVDESYPDGLQPSEIATHIAENKAKAFIEQSVDHIVITADTIVAFEQEILGKPKDALHASNSLHRLSGNRHQVYTGVSIAYDGNITSFYDVTDVFFNNLTTEQIDHYIEVYQPFDKAGSYGIQDWIGLVAVNKIVGSYTNVMGLPTEKLYQVLMSI